MFSSTKYGTPGSLIKDADIDWREKVVFLDASKWFGVAATQVGSTGLFGIPWTSTTGTVETAVMCYDLDLNRPIYFNVHWVTNNTNVASTSLTFKLLYEALVPGTTVVATPATALDVAIPTEPTIPATFEWIRGAQGRINSRSIASNVWALAIQLSVSAFSGMSASADVWVIGVEMAYTPKKTNGLDGMLFEPRRPINLLGTTY